MYSRSYTAEKLSNLPSGYDGCAFGEESRPQCNSSCILGESKSEREDGCDSQDSIEAFGRQDRGGGFLSGIFDSLLGKGGGISSLRFPKIGVEEILIIATALFLLFSKDGDTECAILLLLLLLIN